MKKLHYYWVIISIVSIGYVACEAKVNIDTINAKASLTVPDKNIMKASLTVPDKNIMIEDGEYKDRGYKQVTIPNSVEMIGANAFADNQLTSITIPTSVVFIGAKAFVGNPLLTVVLSKMLYLEMKAKLQDIFGTQVTTYQDHKGKTLNTEEERKTPSELGTPSDSSDIEEEVLFISSEHINGKRVTIPEGTEFVDYASLKTIQGQYTSVVLPKSIKRIPFFINNNIETVTFLGKMLPFNKGGFTFPTVSFFRNPRLKEFIMPRASWSSVTEGIDVSGDYRYPSAMAYVVSKLRLMFCLAVEQTGKSCANKEEARRYKTKVTIHLQEYGKRVGTIAILPDTDEKDRQIAISIPEDITEVEADWFQNMYLNTVRIPDSVKFVGDGAFTDNPELATVTLSKALYKTLKSTLDGIFGEQVTTYQDHEGNPLNTADTSTPEETPSEEISLFTSPTLENGVLTFPKGITHLSEFNFMNKGIHTIEFLGNMPLYPVTFYYYHLLSNNPLEKIIIPRASWSQAIDKVNIDNLNAGKSPESYSSRIVFVRKKLRQIFCYARKGMGNCNKESIANTQVTIELKEYGNIIGKLILPKNKKRVDLYVSERHKFEKIEGERIESDWFKNMRLSRIIIPATVNDIGEGSFADNKLPSITIPSSVTSIADGAFTGNEKLTEVTMHGTLYRKLVKSDRLSKVFGDTVSKYYYLKKNGEKIGTVNDHGFMNNKPTTRITPNNTSSINADAFSSMHFSEVNIPNTVTHIGNRAFQDNEIFYLILPESVDTIGDEAFTFNQSLKYIDLYNTLYRKLAKSDRLSKVFGDAVREYYLKKNGEKIGTVNYPSFLGGKLMIRITPNNTSSINAEAFSSMHFSEVNIPNTVTHIGNRAFQDNDIFYLMLPESVDTIGDGAFTGNSNLKYIGLYNTLYGNLVKEKRLDAVFGGQVTTYLLKGYTNTPEQIIGRITVNRTNGDVERTLTIPNGITIDFEDHYKPFKEYDITKLIISEGVKINMHHAFANNPRLYTVTLPEKIYDTLKTKLEVMFGTQVTTYQDHKGKTLNDADTDMDTSEEIKPTPHALENGVLTFPNGTNTIAAGSFASKNLISVTIPHTVTSIGDGAFTGNPKLTRVALYNTLYRTLAKDDALDAVFGEQVKWYSILSELRKREDKEIGSITVNRSEGTVKRTFEIRRNRTTIKGDFLSNSQLDAVTIPKSVTTIHDGAFTGNLKLITVTLHTTLYGTLAKSKKLDAVFGDKITTYNIRKAKESRNKMLKYYEDGTLYDDIGIITADRTTSPATKTLTIPVETAVELIKSAVVKGDFTTVIITSKIYKELKSTLDTIFGEQVTTYQDHDGSKFN